MVTSFIKSIIKSSLNEGLKIWYSMVGCFREHGITVTSNGKRLLSFQNKYQGKRCFLIGNGPSLQIQDLDKISQYQEVSFGCNMIYKLYQQSKWRPTYHFITDPVYAEKLSEKIAENVETTLFVHQKAYHKMKRKPSNIVYVNCIGRKKYKVSRNILGYYIPSKATVMTFMIEMAIFMGFTEIYLIGVDCTNSFMKGHFTKDYTSSEVDIYNLEQARKNLHNPDLSLEELGDYRRKRTIIAYQKLLDYSKRKNVMIYNATRGGELEVFERVDFDLLFAGGKNEYYECN